MNTLTIYTWYIWVLDRNIYEIPGAESTVTRAYAPSSSVFRR